MKDAMWAPRIIVIIFVSCLPYGYEFSCDVYGAPPASQLLCSMSSQWYFTSFTWLWSYQEQEQLKYSLFVLKEVKVVTTPLQGSGVKFFPNIHWKANVQASECWHVWWALSLSLLSLNSIIWQQSLGHMSSFHDLFFIFHLTYTLIFRVQQMVLT